MNRHWMVTAATAAALTVGQPALAQSIYGEVTKVDRAQQKIGLKHDEIKNLDMPAMSMVFRVKDPAMLDAVKVGDKVRFDADKVNGQYTLIRISPAK